MFFACFFAFLRYLFFLSVFKIVSLWKIVVFMFAVVSFESDLISFSDGLTPFTVLHILAEFSFSSTRNKE